MHNLEFKEFLSESTEFSASLIEGLQKFIPKVKLDEILPKIINLPLP